MRAEVDRSFDLFGTRVRVLVGAPARPSRPPELAALEIEALLRGLQRDLSRFDPASALSRLNADPARTVSTPPVLARLVAEAREAAIASGGLVDSALIEPLERIGYGRSRAGMDPADLAEALEAAPERRPARPRPGSGWKSLTADVAGGWVERPVGMRIDSGGIGKGLAADLAAKRLRDYTSFAVDCGGDLRIGGRSGEARNVEVLHPLDAETGLVLEVASGGVATSGLRSRIWRSDAGYFHHLIDPSSGDPAWTGVLQVTALARSATRAEVLATTALLAGPRGARRILGAEGGVLILDSGRVELIGEVSRSDSGIARAA